MRAKSSGFLPLILLALVVLVAWVAWGPVRTVGNIQKAIRAGDTTQLAKDIDFPMLRTNIKARLNREVSKAAKIDGTPANLAVEILGNATLGHVVDMVVKPEWVAGAAMGAEAGRMGLGKMEQQREQVEQQLEGKHNLSFKSPNLAHLSYQDGKTAGGIILMMERRGLNWVLVDVDLIIPKKQGGS